jgi:hypothetical protein
MSGNMWVEYGVEYVINGIYKRDAPYTEREDAANALRMYHLLDSGAVLVSRTAMQVRRMIGRRVTTSVLTSDWKQES